MTSSGRCHGPGCRETAVVDGGFCGERCQERWHGQFDSDPTWRVGVRLAAVPGSAMVQWGEVAARSMAGMQASVASAAAALAGLGVVAAEVREQDDRLRAAFWPEERAEEAIAEVRELAHTSPLTYQQAVDKVIDDYARARAAEHATDQTHGWLSKLIDRWTGRTP